MTELKRGLDRALSGMEFSPDNRLSVREAMRLEGDVTMRKKMSSALVLAVIAVLILAGVAFAAVVTKGFGWFATWVDDPAWQYNMNELNRRAEDILARQIVFNADGTREVFRFEATQGYYDGTRADVSYSLAVLDYSADTAWRPSADELSRMECLEKGIELMFPDGFEAASAAFARDFKTQGVGGAHIHGYYLGDGVWLPDGRRLDWEDGAGEWADGVMIGYRRIGELPKEVRNKPSVQLIFRVKEYDFYYYKDETGFYCRQKKGREFDLDPVTLKRVEGNNQIARGTEDFAKYVVWTEAKISPVGVDATIWQKLPDEWVVPDAWTRSEDLRGVDYIKDYRLYANGAQLEGSMNSERTGGDAIASEDFSGEKAEFPEVFASEDPWRLYEFGCQFQGVPEGTQEIRLRPVYSISGERPEEDVVLKMPDTPSD